MMGHSKWRVWCGLYISTSHVLCCFGFFQLTCCILFSFALTVTARPGSFVSSLPPLQPFYFSLPSQPGVEEEAKLYREIATLDEEVNMNVLEVSNE